MYNVQWYEAKIMTVKFNQSLLMQIVKRYANFSVFFAIFIYRDTLYDIIVTCEAFSFV